MNTLPDEELDRFLDTVDEAVLLARGNNVVAGFQSLYAGQEYAETLADEGEEWAAGLARRYQDALNCYARNYGAKLLDPET